MSAPVPLIAHAIFRLDVGGLENGLVNLVNNLPAERFRHAIICLEGFSERFRLRLKRADVEIHALGKRAGKDPALALRLFKLLRRLRPDILHTRNLGTLECQFVGAAAGVRHRVHGEHGWDVVDLHGDRRRYRWLRRASTLVVHRYVPMSRHLQRWLESRVGVPAERIVQIYNGVETARFAPGGPDRRAVLPAGFADADSVVVGTVGRLSAVKDQLTLARAFAHLVQESPAASKLKLVVVGDGPLREPLRELVTSAGIESSVWLAGMRDDVPALLQALDVFVLPSLNEGISNTILEAMATGLPVVATDVGGNAELVLPERNGLLCPAQDPAAMAAALRRYVEDPALRAAHGAEGRQRVLREFALATMVERYSALYSELLATDRHGVAFREIA